MELSRKYIGRKVKIIGRTHDWYYRHRNAPSETLIIGIKTYQYVVYKSAEYGGYRLSTKDGILDNAWLMHPAYLELIDDHMPNLNIKPYPNKCPICQSPARRNKAVLLCSNLKCKSRKAYHRSLLRSKKAYMPLLRDKKNRLLCCECGAFIGGTYSDPYGNGKRGYCEKTHAHITQVGIQDGDVVFRSGETFSFRYQAFNNTWIKIPTISI